MKELLKELKECELDSKEYLEEWLSSDKEAQENFPTIEEYDNCVGMVDELFVARIYDLAVYNLCKRLREKYGKTE